MQRYGPPPSYPSMRIPGLNAPIPPGAKFGYQADGWGKPPVDEYGRPLYGDVFGTAVDDGADYEANLDKSRWGEVTVLEEYSEDEDEEDEDEEDEEEVGDDLSGMATPSTLDGTQSMASGLETPDTIDLRKRTGMETPDLGAGPPQELFQVLRETRAGKSEGAIFGSEKTYVLPGRGDVEMSINPDQLETQLGELGDQEGLQDAYDAQKAAVGAGGPTEGDLNDINDPREKRKRRADTSMAAKRHKDFKF